MKENKYDNQEFFEKYSQMQRSVKGLDGAGEWERFRKMMPDFTGKRVLDLGCGYGWHCAYAVQKGAAAVLGIDLSKKMLETAKGRNAHERITYRRCAIEDFQAEEESFDVVLSSLALHYVEDYEGVTERIYRMLSPGGNFVFSAEHPVFTAYGSQDWYYGEDGEILHFPVDRYFEEGPREAVFLGEKVRKYHRTVTTYLNTLLKKGFVIKEVAEPTPPEHMMDLPGMADELRRPMMLLVSAKKEG